MLWPETGSNWIQMPSLLTPILSGLPRDIEQKTYCRLNNDDHGSQVRTNPHNFKRREYIVQYIGEKAKSTRTPQYSCPKQQKNSAEPWYLYKTDSFLSRRISCCKRAGLGLFLHEYDGVSENTGNPQWHTLEKPKRRVHRFALHIT